jgi:hypothetical protein
MYILPKRIQEPQMAVMSWYSQSIRAGPLEKRKHKYQVDSSLSISKFEKRISVSFLPPTDKQTQWDSLRKKSQCAQEITYSEWLQYRELCLKEVSLYIASQK